VNYILDTDILIYFLKGREAVIKKVTAIPADALYTTIISHAELLFGAYHSEQEKKNLNTVKTFLKNFSILPFCENASHFFGQQKAFLKSKGTPVADMDLMIASIALQNEMILVTNNTKHFNRIKSLTLENWV